ncbi:MAG: hypothetical protein BWX62_00086 [Bacteroidetes bacterium ADurb.Bin037]|nr:MAG: hypothetical protein BWX62_00086 [Bacteroidetes bacterium ADurb.Bin037]
MNINLNLIFKIAGIAGPLIMMICLIIMAWG